MTGNNNIKVCGFCSRDEYSVEYLFYSRKYELDICNYCVLNMASMIKETSICFETYTPLELKRAICDKVHGQDEAVKRLAVTIFKHIHNIHNSNNNSNHNHMKSNLLLIGDSGCGKTFMMEVAGKLLGMPILVVDCTSLTAVGYIGDDVESVMSRLFKLYNCDIEKAKNGIIFLDEFDKIAASKRDMHDKGGVGSTSVQQELLKVMEGATIEFVLDNKRPQAFSNKQIKLNTKNILVVAGGSFTGLKETLKKSHFAVGDSFFRPMDKYGRESKKSVILTKAIEEFGIIKELIGRFSGITILNELQIQDFINILNSNDSQLKQYIEMVSKYNIIVDLEDGIIEFIAERAHEIGIGARGIAYIIGKIFDDDILFNIERNKTKKTFFITKKYIQERLDEQSYLKIVKNN